MDPRDLLAQRAVPVSLTPHVTSYWSMPRAELDPTLFLRDAVRPEIRRGQLSDALRFLERHYAQPAAWATIWLAGSSASYQWASDPESGDLDLLIGVDYGAFRATNPGYDSVSDADISALITADCRAFNGPWGRFDRTLYSNPNASDIRSIKPYAAYNLTSNVWTVHPDPLQAAPDSPALQRAAADFDARTEAVVKDYDQALVEYRSSTTDAARLKAAVRLRRAATAAAGLWTEIHEGRRLAFGPEGTGYSDPHEYAWKAAKSSGAAAALHTIKAENDDVYADPDAGVDRALITTALHRRHP